MMVNATAQEFSFFISGFVQCDRQSFFWNLQRAIKPGLRRYLSDTIFIRSYSEKAL